MGERGEEQAEVSGFVATPDHGDIWAWGAAGAHV